MPGHLPRNVEADDAVALERVTARFRELLARQKTKPASAFEHMAVQCCDAAGRIAHRLIEQRRLTLPNLPGEFETTPEEVHPNEPEIWFEDNEGAHREANIITCYEQWWLAFLGWLARRDDLVAVIVDPRLQPALDRCLNGFMVRRDYLFLIGLPDSNDSPELWPLVCESAIQAIDYFVGVLQHGESLEAEPPPLADIQQLVWNCLAGRKLTAKELVTVFANEHGHETTEEGIRQLVRTIREKLGRPDAIKNARPGYYRPDAPPPC